jgi:hypothetical protein
MQRKYLFMLTALGEGGIGLALLLSPALPLALLLGAEASLPETDFYGRIAGAALLAFGIACCMARCEHGGRAQQGLLQGSLVYDVAASATLAHSSVWAHETGIALWPAVALHITLAVWCIVCMLQTNGYSTDKTASGEKQA